MALPEQAQRLLLQLLGMTGSDHDGEVLAAVRKAHQLVKGHGATLIEALQTTASNAIDLRRLTALEEDAYRRGYEAGRAASTADDGMAAVEDVPCGPSWQVFAHLCLRDHAAWCTSWERNFLQDWIDRGWSNPTPKQRAIFERLSNKCGVSLP